MIVSVLVQKFCAFFATQRFFVSTGVQCCPESDQSSPFLPTMFFFRSSLILSSHLGFVSDSVKAEAVLVQVLVSKQRQR